ncbi:MAG: purine-nucleoside phosphorylase, partial [Exiguobacterium sp.]|nr:purine-nucleoside phosphorylase [Exiguobacterium sp.]
MVNWNETKAYLQERMGSTPEIGLILGSGLGVLADEIENPVAIPYEEIPHFPVSTVEGHAGQLVFGELEGKRVVAMQGRFHFYEGYSMEQVTFPVRVLKLIGVETLIVTNAAGACNESFNPGDLMIITDHINFFGTNPLIGKNASE